MQSEIQSTMRERWRMPWPGCTFQDATFPLAWTLTGLTALRVQKKNEKGVRLKHIQAGGDHHF
jgi:hypothetical protein